MAKARRIPRANPRGICESCLQRFGIRMEITPGRHCEFYGNLICGTCGEPHEKGKCDYA